MRAHEGCDRLGALEAAVRRGVEPAVGDEAGGDRVAIAGVERAQAEREEIEDREPVCCGEWHAVLRECDWPSPSPSHRG